MVLRAYSIRIPKDRIMIEGTYEYEFRNRLEFLTEHYRKMICDNFTLRRNLMEDDYKTALYDMISLKIIRWTKYEKKTKPEASTTNR